MIKFFRKIRYDLMEKNKTGKYFKYAIGEFLLVVIGILVALQINNWNENKQAQTRVDSRLINMTNDIESDIEEMKRYSPSSQRQDYSSQVYFRRFKSLGQLWSF